MYRLSAWVFFFEFDPTDISLVRFFGLRNISYEMYRFRMTGVLFVAGYTDILLIPAGATNIRVREIQPSNNYLGNFVNSFFFFFNTYVSGGVNRV